MQITRFKQLLFIAILFGISAILTTYIASYYIHTTFSFPPVVKDLLWEKLPYLPVLWMSELFLVTSTVFLFFWALKNDKFMIPYVIIMCSIFHTLRAGLIILTPLGFPYEYNGFMHYGQESVFMYGAFPSGHLSVPYIIFLVTKSKIALALTFIVGLTLLISQSHYSIDIIGTLLLAYPTFKLSEKYLRKYFKEEKTKNDS
jgi:hypothetical protein